MEVRFNAFDRDHSGSHSRDVIAETREEIQAEWKKFEQEVPFSRWYQDNEFIDGSDSDEDWFENWSEGL